MPALPPDAEFASGSVEYYDYASGPDALKELLAASPEKIVRSKPRHRFAFSETTALNAGSARYCLREFSPAPNPNEHYSKLLRLEGQRHLKAPRTGCGEGGIPARIELDPTRIYNLINSCFRFSSPIRREICKSNDCSHY
jgi:hypothetical protein